jgi:hypothetical protein
MRAAMVGFWGDSVAAAGLEARSCGDEAGVTGIETIVLSPDVFGLFQIQREHLQ